MYILQPDEHKTDGKVCGMSQSATSCRSQQTLAVLVANLFRQLVTHLHRILTSGSVRPSPPNKNKFGEGVDALFSVRGREET